MLPYAFCGVCIAVIFVICVMGRISKYAQSDRCVWWVGGWVGCFVFKDTQKNCRKSTRVSMKALLRLYYGSITALLKLY
jgi:hypothetical protein